MSDEDSKEIRKIFTAILDKIALHDKLDQQLKKWLEPHLAEHVHVINLQEESLILTVDNGGLATQLRFIIPTLLEKFKQHTEIAEVKTIRYFVKTPDEHQIQPIQRMELSEETKYLLQTLADQTTHTRLQQALRRLVTPPL